MAAEITQSLLGRGEETKGDNPNQYDKDDVNPDRKGALSGTTEKLSKHILPI